MLLCEAHNRRLFYFSGVERRLFKGGTDKKRQVEIRLEHKKGGRRRGFESEERRLCAN